MFEKKANDFNLVTDKNKSKITIFSRQKNPSHVISYITQYEVVKKYKYLCHIIENNFSDKLDVELRLNFFMQNLIRYSGNLLILMHFCFYLRLTVCPIMD